MAGGMLGGVYERSEGLEEARERGGGAPSCFWGGPSCLFLGGGGSLMRSLMTLFLLGSTGLINVPFVFFLLLKNYSLAQIREFRQG